MRLGILSTLCQQHIYIYILTRATVEVHNVLFKRFLDLGRLRPLYKKLIDLDKNTTAS